MSYYISTRVDGRFDDVVDRVIAALKDQGFGVLSDIDIAATMKAKLDKDLRPYRILGACNPGFAFKALQAEDKIGVMLPCNVIVQQREDGRIEVSAVDPAASMQAVENPALADLAGDVKAMLAKMIQSLN
ncbi:DUF302 domain-containing protein [Hyphobacterium marinum]|uniref:DUF302 domain-containing protein n=1 Tax=Hyphobacterium marinum TaxID=3116574 RepID=A0ABU7LUD6_9PROT|nr:DUF302 domain-containing protein [Hyphobacterium sp. Y6023]MEE2565149.1 DUF302 domain-containing protein [Hyphobacterium sp. Y6023]